MLQEKFHNKFHQLLNDGISQDQQLKASQKIAIAVSGGSDSVALLYLFSDYASKHNIKLVIFYVDHNLRPESKDELHYVEKISKSLNHEFYAFSWECGDKKTAIQERARIARYDLMTDKCQELGIKLLLTAHHFDDMIETYLMRKKRGGGVFGLSYGYNFFYNNIRILRPLLDFTKTDLLYCLKKHNIKWLEDISNMSDTYERNRVRKQISSFSDEQKNEVIQEMQQIKQLATDLNEELIAVIAESLQINKYGFAMLDLNFLNHSCDDIMIQVINYALTIISGKTIIPRFRNIHPLLSKIKSSEKIDCSLHGCILKKLDSNLLIFREKNAISKPVLLLNNQYWDNRFKLNTTIDDTNYYIDFLKNDDYLKIKNNLNLENLAKISQNNHKSILFTLPVLKYLEKVVAIPHIYYYDDLKLKTDITINFKPKFVSRFTHFF